ncbi:MAG: arginine--tRNA ligase [Candidatus Kerfeldbacteria bacterium]|nr:arginine--tRNA ligase [Candidatus Kerfeldbacteria bacterium]
MKQEISSAIRDALRKLQIAHGWGDVIDVAFHVGHPQDEHHGDYACNVAMILSSVLRVNTLELGEWINDELERNVEFAKSFQRIEVVPPGFLNFTLSHEYLSSFVEVILDQEEKFGRTNTGKKERIQVEFISANPTGPLTFANGRGGFTGDVLSNVLSWAGYHVFKEYYWNDRGKQIEILGDSVTRRWLQMQGVKVPYPEECYQGEYISDIAKKLHLKDYKLQNIKKIEKVRERISEAAVKIMKEEIQEVVGKKMGIAYHYWFSEKTLYENGEVEKVLEALRKQDLLYTNDGALWMKTSKFGDDKDRVIVKSDGEYTYFMSDAAYLWNKFCVRSFDRVILILGADHHGHIGRIQAAASAIGKPGKLDILIMQLVKLIKNGEEIRMSKRAGNFVPIADVIDEVGLDAARFFFLMNAASNHMDFDLDLAKERSEKNPVYYVQYAHARICQIMNKIATDHQDMKRVSYERFEFHDPAELSLLRELMKLPELVSEIAGSYEVHRLPYYAINLARKFHWFYTQCRVIDEGEVNINRLALIRATKTVLANTLTLMGITAPKRMS